MKKFEMKLFATLVVAFALMIGLATIKETHFTQDGIQIEFKDGTGYWIEK